MLWDALEKSNTEPNQALWVGNSVKEDHSCAKEIGNGLEFYFADKFFQIWEEQAGAHLGTESAMDGVTVNNVAEEDEEDVVMKEGETETETETEAETGRRKRALVDTGDGKTAKSKKKKSSSSSNTMWNGLLYNN